MAEGGQQYWTGENYELELSKFLLSQDNMALRSEMKSLRQALNEATKLIDDLEEICRVSVQMDVPTCTCSERNYLRELRLEEKHQLSLRKINQDLHEKVTTIQRLESATEEHLTTIEELRTENKRLEVQLWKALVFGGPHVEQPMAEAEDVEQLPHSDVEVSDVQEEEEEIEQDASSDVQTKSWWRRQASKMCKGMGNFRRHFKFCFGVRTRRSHEDQDRNMDIGMALVSASIMPASVIMPLVSVGMLPASV